MAAIFLDRVRVMQRPRLTKTGGATAAAVAELGQGSSSARKKMREREVPESPSGRPIYKGELVKRARESRRPRRGYLPTKRLDFRDNSKDKIRCGSGGVKNGLNGG